MKPIRLYLKNSIGIKHGLNREEFEIDFTQYEPGLIGIIGRTGVGKTVLIENMSPYLKFFTRGGSLQSQFYGSDAMREFEFEMSGIHYLSKIFIDADGNKIKPYLYIYDKDGQHTLLNDKIGEYKDLINDILGSHESYKRSIFSAQKNDPIVTLADAELKRMLVNLFRLERYTETYLPVVKLEIDQLDENMRSAKAIITVYEQELEHKESFETKKQYLADKIPELERGVELIKTELADCDKDIENKNKEIADIKLYLQEINSLKQKHNHVETRIKDIVKGFLEKIESLEAQIKNNSTDIETTQHQVLAEEHQVKRAQKIVENEEVIVEKYKELINLKTDLEELNKKAESLNLLKKDKDRVSTQLYSQNELLQSETEVLNEWKNRAKLLNEVPCSALDINKECSLLDNARSASNGIEDKQNGTEQITKEIEATTKALGVVNAEIQSIGDVNTKDLEAEIRTLENESWEQVHNELRSSKTTVDKFNQTILNLNQRIETCFAVDVDLNKRLQKAQNEIDTATDDQKKELEQIDQQIEVVEKKVKNVLIYEDQLRELKGKHDGIQSSLLNATEQRATIVSDIKVYDKKIANIEEKMVTIGEKKKSIEGALNDWEDWKRLEQVFRDIPVYELESSSILLTDYVNDLLSGLFDRDISVKIITLMPRKTDKNEMKDVFKIIIYNDGKEVLADVLSGGETQIIDSAVRLGVELTINDLSNRHYQSSFYDEADSQIDTERALKFYEMLEKVHKKNNKYFTFVISHRTEVKKSFEQVIDMEDFLV